MKDKINYEWHWVNKDGVDEKLPSAEYPDVFHVSLDGKNMTVMVPDIDENDPESYKKYNAIVNKEFYLIVGHDYETVRVNFTVNGVEAVPPGMITLVLIKIISPEVKGCSIFSNSIFSYFFIGQGKKNIEGKIVDLFLFISLNICFGCSKNPSHWDSSFEYPQHMFSLRNKKNGFCIVNNFCSDNGFYYKKR